ncbi:MAG: hypothetical protein K2X38_12385 [Gemmataceae bacterium]|nr:hypothetical protein [Gemmataceae bacterium]
MLSPRGRLALFSFLFLGWIGWLGYLVSKTRDPIVLSRPQILVSNYVAVLRIGDKDGKPSAETLVAETLKQPAAGPALAKSITVRDLPNLDASHGWRGPGEYLVPLTVMNEQKNILITPVPMSPGFQPRNEPDVRIYPATPEVLRQFQLLGK